MRRNLEKSLEEFNQMTKKKMNRKGRITSTELAELLHISVQESKKACGTISPITFVYTAWKIGYIAGLHCARNERRKH